MLTPDKRLALILGLSKGDDLQIKMALEEVDLENRFYLQAFNYIFDPKLRERRTISQLARDVYSARKMNEAIECIKEKDENLGVHAIELTHFPSCTTVFSSESELIRIKYETINNQKKYSLIKSKVVDFTIVFRGTDGFKCSLRSLLDWCTNY